MMLSGLMSKEEKSKFGSIVCEASPPDPLSEKERGRNSHPKPLKGL
jgi:hypothetical protein